MKCPQCGIANPEDFAFCLQCGEQLNASQPERARAPDGSGQPEPAYAPPSFGRPAQPSARVRVEQGSVDQREFELDKAELVIGRRQGSDIVIHDTNVSRRHARLIRQPGGFAIEDAESANGTLVNDERIEGVRPLRHGDAIRIGDAVFVFEETAPLEEREGMTTVAIDDESPMTRLGPPIDLEPPAALAPKVASPAGPLTPPPPIMESGYTAIGESIFDEEEHRRSSEEPEPAPAPAEPAASVEAERRTPPGAAVPALDVIRRDLSELNRDLGAFASSVAGLADRVERLERSLAEVSADLGQLAQAARGPEAEPLRELSGLLEETEAVGGPDRLQPIIDLLDQLAAQPRDIELLLKLSQQAGALYDLMRLHLRIVAAGPKVREALARIVG
jgi:pSer/pThr/pTyr-binding forkhead associated (FHA) protein